MPINASRLTDAPKQVQRQFTARKWGGDDAESWAVFVNGRMAFNGMNRRSVSYYKQLAYEIELKRKGGMY